MKAAFLAAAFDVYEPCKKAWTGWPRKRTLKQGTFGSDRKYTYIHVYNTAYIIYIPVLNHKNIYTQMFSVRASWSPQASLQGMLDQF